MFPNYAVTLNGKHIYKDYGLYVVNTNPVEPPEVQEEYITIPGRDGDIDLTQTLTGYSVYGNRIISLQLGGRKPAREWPGFMSNFLNEYHGKKVKVIFDNDPEFYYIGRAIVESDYQKGNEIATFTMSINADPYKYTALSSTDPWLWDPFSFADGVIRYYGNITVDGTREVVVAGSEKPTIPIIIANVPMEVTFSGKTFELKAGTNKIYDIVLMNQEYSMVFTGNGTVSIQYQAGRI